MFAVWYETERGGLDVFETNDTLPDGVYVANGQGFHVDGRRFKDLHRGMDGQPAMVGQLFARWLMDQDEKWSESAIWDAYKTFKRSLFNSKR